MELFCGDEVQEFPKHADYACITGNNLAFFFVETENAVLQGADPWLDTFFLEELIKNIVAQDSIAALRPTIILQVDADLFENQARFVEKYQHLRPESDKATREKILAKEAELIRDFVNQGGIRALVQKSLTDAFQNDDTGSVDECLASNFKLFGLRTEKPLRFSLWDVSASEEKAVIVQQYYTPHTASTQRFTIAGMKKSVMALAREGCEEGFEEATRLFEATDLIANLPTIDLTNGYTPRARPKFEEGQKPSPQSGIGGPPFN